MIKNRLRAFDSSFIFFILIILYSASYFFTGKLGQFFSLSSLTFLFYFPGHFLNKWLVDVQEFSLLDFVLSLISSLALFFLSLLFFRAILVLDARNLSIFLIIFNLALWVLDLIRKTLIKRRILSSLSLPLKQSQLNLTDYFFLLTPLTLFCIDCLLSPHLQDGDSYYFIYAALDSIQVKMDISPYITRPAFIPWIILVNLTSRVSLVTIFRLIIPLLAYVSSFLAFWFIKNYAQNPKGARWFFLLFLAAPVLASEIDIARPQVIIFAFTIPILLFLSLFLREHKWQYFALSFFYSISILKVHELSYNLLITCLFVGVFFVIHIFWLARKNGSLIKKYFLNLGLLFVIAFPYVYFLRIFNSGYIFTVIESVITQYFRDINWRWWFLNNYTSDGQQLGWVGRQAILYYLYNGLQFLFALFILGFFALKNKLINIWLLVPVLFYGGIYLAVAEFLPRIGLFLYPNRAWPHLMIACWLAAIFLSLDLKVNHFKQRYLVLPILIFLVALGAGGWFKADLDKGGFYNKDEQKVAEYIGNKLESNALLVSSQGTNNAIVRVYAHKTMEAISLPDTLKNTVNFTEVYSYLNSDLRNKQVIDNATFFQTTTVRDIYGNVVDQKVISFVDPKKIIYPSADKRPIYLYYSFSRFEGLLGSRDWWKDANDYKHYQLFKTYLSPSVVYKDDAGIIIKIQ